ncbi:hypothetical protein GBA52_003117 [Prunus armeniaca]|nr:hypothetical protein GBA52_003117 [Prunus armeniaca]
MNFSVDTSVLVIFTSGIYWIRKPQQKFVCWNSEKAATSPLSLSQSQKESWRTILTLAYQSLGVVYGDLSTSPLYVYKSTFAEDIEHSETNEEIFGVLSFVFWTLTLVPLLKYVFIVLKADDNGEGGTFALYSLLCRHARVSSLPNCQLADEELSDYKKENTGSSLQSSFGTSIFCGFRAGVFCVRKASQIAIGLYNILHFNPSVYKALSPHYMYKFLKKTQKGGWMSLGGILLCITGSEAMFADLGHFSQLSIKIAFTSLVYPALILAYMGQAAYISSHHTIGSNPKIGFYVSVPAEFIRSGSPESNVTSEDLGKEDDKMTVVGTRSTHADGIQMSEHSTEMNESVQREIRSPPPTQRRKKVRFIVPESPKINTGTREELQELMEAREAGIAYILGNTYMNAKKGSSWMRRFAIDYGYEFLRRNSRTSSYALSVPHASTLEVGMIYHI